MFGHAPNISEGCALHITKEKKNPRALLVLLRNIGTSVKTSEVQTMLKQNHRNHPSNQMALYPFNLTFNMSFSAFNCTFSCRNRTNVSQNTGLKHNLGGLEHKTFLNNRRNSLSSVSSFANLILKLRKER